MTRARTVRQDALAKLAAALQQAVDLASSLDHDGHLDRLLAAFDRFPASDRRPLLEKLEQEAEARQRSLEVGDGQVGPPNPDASLYIRVYENDRPLPPVTRDTMLRSTMQALAVVATFPAQHRATFEETLLAGMMALDPGDAAALAGHHHDLQALAAWSDREDGYPAGTTVSSGTPVPS